MFKCVLEAQTVAKIGVELKRAKDTFSIPLNYWRLSNESCTALNEKGSSEAGNAVHIRIVTTVAP